MKNILLSCFAAAALTLSFCFEKTPDASASAGTAPHAVPAVAEASLFSGLLADAGYQPVSGSRLLALLCGMS